jgi:aspartate/methionine/tyrosine aminotransferase
MRAYVSYCAPTPLQAGVAAALDSLSLDKDDIGARFHANFELLAAALRAAGAEVFEAGGGYFLVADVAASGLGAMDFCRRLARRHKVAAVPMSVFCREETPATRSLVRFAVCKRRETINKACEHLTSEIMSP